MSLDKAGYERKSPSAELEHTDKVKFESTPDGFKYSSALCIEDLEPKENIEPIREAESMLAEHIGECHKLIEDTKVMALTVALRYGDLVKQDITKQFQEQLDKKQRYFEERIQIEKEKSIKGAERVRREYQDRLRSIASTIRANFKEEMESKDAEICHLRSKIKDLEIGVFEAKQNEWILNKKQIDMRCSFCGGSSNAPFVCSGCWMAFYCGEKCQRFHWSVHEQVCSGASSFLDKGTMTSPKA